MMRKTLIPAALLMSGVAAADACPTRLLVSGYGSDDVHVYDACDGRFVQRLDRAGRIDGAQAMVTDDRGRLYVVSEENGRVLRYRSADLEFIDILAGPGGRAPLSAKRPTGIAIGPGGDVFVAGYDSNDIVRLDANSGTELERYPLAEVGLAGADSGIAFLPDGRLLVPGFDSGNVVALDPESGSAEEFIPAGSGGLANPRVIRVKPDEDRILVSSWGSNRVLAFDLGGNPRGEVLSVRSPTGFLERADGGWLVTTDAVPRVGIVDRSGRLTDELVGSDNGGLSGATFLLRLPPTGSDGPADDGA